MRHYNEKIEHCDRIMDIEMRQKSTIVKQGTIRIV